MRIISTITLIALAAGLAGATVVRAQVRPQTEQVVRLTVRPSATTQPSLRYKLLPDLIDQTPGNAATMYLIASKLGPDADRAYKLMNQANDYLDGPTDQLPREKAREVLKYFPSRLRLADLAAHREQAQWDYSLREEGVDALLPHLNDMRGLANLWSLQGRLQILNKEWAAAARTTSDGFALARQLDHQAVLVQGLVGAGIADETMARNVRDWVSQPGSPNLYWSLSSLPTPFFDVHEIERWEKPIIYFTFPVLADARRGKVDASRWRDFFVKLPAISRSKSLAQRITPDMQAEAAVLAARNYPRARAYLLANGRTPQEVEAMAVDEAVGIYFFEQYRALAGEAWKAWELPFWEGGAELRRWSAQAAAEATGPEANPLAVFAPRTERARLQFARIDREIALLRIVEAVRDHAARHDGRPPASLDEIKDLPIPIDPVRGQPFQYEQHGQTVTVDAPSYDQYPADGERYEVTVVK